MSHPNRRTFMKQTALGAGALAGYPLMARAAQGDSATDHVELGASGIKVPHVAIGTGLRGFRRSSAQTRAGFESFKKLIRYGIENGLTFIDMADLYGSHSYVKYALEGMDIKREDLTLLTKIWFRPGPGFESSQNAKPKVERFLQEVGSDYLDVCLIHCLGNANWVSELEEMRASMKELKDEGKVRAIGCSCHDFGALKVAAEDPWVDVIFARINNKAVKMDVNKEEDVEKVAAVLKKARSNGKGVVGMKIYGEGQLTSEEQKDASLHYVWDNNLIDAMTIGFEKTEQIDDTINHLTRVLRA